LKSIADNVMWTVQPQEAYWAAVTEYTRTWWIANITNKRGGKNVKRSR
jgi:hypothetical protein